MAGLLSPIQRDLLSRIVAAHRRDPESWYRAETSGERVTLVSLERYGILKRRIWRGANTESPAHEYALSDMFALELRQAHQPKTIEAET
jgi:hypothetical protein